ncbi:MAG: T9SS type A sorting domain-containing protein [Bacteroidota bacterium]
MSNCTSTRTLVQVVVNPNLTPDVAVSASSTSACSGGSITFTATPTNGGATPTYQWYLNGTALTGETASSYVLSTPNSGDQIYVTMVSNATGCLSTSNATGNTITLTSSASTPTVSIASNTATTICPGTSVSFSVNSSSNMGASPTYQWYLNGFAVSGATNDTYVNASLNSNDQVSLIMTSSLSGACLTTSNATSSAITFTVNAATTIATQPSAQGVCSGSSATFSVVGAGTGTLTYQWRKNGTNITGNATAITANLTLGAVVAGDVANYSVVVGGTCGTATSNNAALSLNTATSISTQPAAVTQCSGTSATFSVVANGQGALSYQWRKAGVNISGANSASYTINPIASGDAAAYSVAVTGGCGTINSSSANLTVNPATAIATQPVASTLCAGNTANFSVAATGQAPITYQWSKDGANISGATSSTYSIASAQAANGGQYTVTVSGGCGSVTSNQALLTVNVAPTVSTQPTAAASCDGTPATFSVAAAGSGTLAYQWKFGGVNISGATNSSYTIPAVNTSNAGSYSVSITGTCGSVNSSAALLTVNANPSTPSITNTGSLAICQGNTVQLNAPMATTWLWSNGETTQNITTGTAGNYSVIVSNANGCTATSAAQTVTVYSLPSPAITGTTTACGTVSLTASGGTSYAWNTGNSATTAANNFTTVGSYTVTVTATNSNGCTSNASQAITVNEVPSNTITFGGPSAICSGASTSISVPSGASYLWSNGATTNAITVTTAGTYTVTATSGAGCTSTSSQAVVALTNPVAAVSSSAPNMTCTINSVSFTATGGNTYAWSTGATTSGISTSTVGMYTVTVTNANGCTDSEQIYVGSNTQAPLVSITTNRPQLTCNHTYSTLNATASGQGLLTYLWNNGSTNSTRTVGVAGTYTVTVTDGANGCTSTTSYNLTSNTTPPTPSISSSVAALTCATTSAQLTASGANSYAWSTGATGSNLNTTTAGTYTVTATGSNGCTATTTYTLASNTTAPSNTVTASAAAFDCNTNSITLTAPVSSAYAWSNGSTASSINVTSAGTYSVTVTGSNGCTSVGTSTVNNNFTTPTVSITANTASLNCSTNSVILTATGGTSYLWNTGATSAQTTVSAAGNYTVTVTGTNGCTYSRNYIVVNNNTVPTANITASGSTTFCAGGSVTLTASPSNSYLWSNGATTQSITATTSGNYTVQVTGSNGCTANSNATTVTVNSSPTAADAGADLTVFSPTYTLAGNNPSSGTGTWSMVNFGGTLSNANLASAVVSGLNAGENKLVWTISNGTCTPSRDTVIVTYDDGCGSIAPVAINATANSICPGQSVTLSLNGGTLGAGATWKWFKGGCGSNQIGSGSSIVVTPSTTSTFYVRASGNCGTTTCIPITITVNNASVPSPITGTPLCPNVGTTTFTVDPIPGATFNWQLPTTMTAVSGQGSNSITVNATGGGRICLTSTNSCGLTSTSRCQTIVSNVPDRPSVISGPTQVCPGTAIATYSVNNVGGLTYNWTLPTGITIIAGQNTNSITVDFGSNFSAGYVSVSATNSTCSTPGPLRNMWVSRDVPPQPSSITGTNPVCPGSTGVTYSVPAISNASFNWTLPAGMTLLSGQGTNSITVDVASNFVQSNLSVSANNTSCAVNGTARTTTVYGALPTIPSPVSGPSAICPNNSTVTFTTNSVAGNTYNWILPAGMTIASGSGTNSITVNVGPTYSQGWVKVTTTAPGCASSSPIRYHWTVKDVVPSPGVITGDAKICPGTSGAVYSVPNDPTLTYQWNLPAGVTIASGSGSNSITVSASASFTQGWVDVTATRAACNVPGPSSNKWVERNVPDMPGFVSGDSLVTPGSNGITYSVPQDSGVAYTWTMPTGMTVASGQGTNSITVNVASNFIQGNIQVTGSFTNCPAPSYIRSFFVERNIPAVPDPIAGPAVVCPNATGVIYSTTGTPGVNYLWTVPTGMTITSGQGLNQISVNIGTSFIQGNVQVTAYYAGDTANQSYPTIKWVTKDAPPTPSTISGLTTVCGNSTNLVYSVTAIANATFNWTVPTGLTLVSGQGTNSIIVNSTSSFIQGLMTVTASSATCPGSSSNQQSITIVKNAPATPAGISGPNQICPGTPATYSVVNPVAGNIYNWTMPSGVTITSGAGTNTVTVNAASNFGQGNIWLSASLPACSTSSSNAVSKLISKDAPATPSTISGPALVCPGSTGIVYSVTNTPGVTYNWTMPSGMTITSGAGTNSITVTAASNFGQGNIWVSGSNPTCLNATSQATSRLIARDVPAAPSTISGPGTVCPNTTGHVYSVTAVTGITYNWTMPTGLTIVSGQGTNSIVVDATSTWSQGNISVTATNSTCGVASNATTRLINKSGCRMADQQIENKIDVVFTAFPIPAHEEVIVKFETEDEAEYRMELYDIKGTLVKTRSEMSTPGKNLMVMDVRSLMSGIYMMRINGSNGHQGNVRIVVQ